MNLYLLFIISILDQSLKNNLEFIVDNIKPALVGYHGLLGPYLVIIQPIFLNLLGQYA